MANEIEKREFSYVLSKHAYHSISEGHLWFSIFSRPISNQVTRVQRCTCCFVLLIVSMFLNIMYYDLWTEAKTSNVTSGLALDSASVNSQQIVIGVIVEFLVLIPSLLLVQVFRRIRFGQPLIPPVRKAIHKINTRLKVKITKSKSGLTLACWCLFLAYGLCLILVGLSIFIIIAGGIEFGDQKGQQWLASIVSGFFSLNH